MTAKVFIDGDVGTTGLQIRARLGERQDVDLIRLGEADRKDPAARSEMLNKADLSILCLPDDASRQAAAMVSNPNAKLLDASTAHRTHPDWVFGMPEMAPNMPAKIAAATRVSNPGCYSTGFITLIRPLVAAGLVPADAAVTANAVSGYSGGGKALIQRYEDAAAPNAISAAHRIYGLTLNHKHVDEMRIHTMLDHRPVFVPSVGRYYKGMLVQVPLQLWALPGKPTAATIRDTLAAHYAGSQFISVENIARLGAIEDLDPEALNGSNDLKVYVFANDREEQALLVAQLDNLGKGASGAAVQNMNLMLGLDPAAGLTERMAA